MYVVVEEYLDSERRGGTTLVVVGPWFVRSGAEEYLRYSDADRRAISKLEPDE